MNLECTKFFLSLGASRNDASLSTLPQKGKSSSYSVYSSIIATVTAMSIKASLKSIYHESYDGLEFPDFVQPLFSRDFGTKIMAQAKRAKYLLKGRKVHSYIRLEHSAENLIWMNLKSFDGEFVKARPVRLKNSH